MKSICESHGFLVQEGHEAYGANLRVTKDGHQYGGLEYGREGHLNECVAPRQVRIGTAGELDCKAVPRQRLNAFQARNGRDMMPGELFRQRVSCGMNAVPGTFCLIGKRLAGHIRDCCR